jgi:hypothetical protein
MAEKIPLNIVVEDVDRLAAALRRIGIDVDPDDEAEMTRAVQFLIDQWLSGALPLPRAPLGA